MITPTQFDDIIDAISTTADGLRKICENAWTDTRSFYRCLELDDENVRRYARAKEKKMSWLFEEVHRVQNLIPPTDENGRTCIPVKKAK